MMKRLPIPCLFFMVFAVFLCAIARADIVILKNGKLIKDVKVTDLGDTILCESQSQTYYISKKSVESIVRTGSKGVTEHLRRWTDTLLSSMPPSARKHINSYPRLIIAGILFIGFITLLFGFLSLLWTRTASICLALKKKRRLTRHVRGLDEHEKSVLREFIIQEQNTIEMPVEDKTVAGMIHKGILEQVGSKGEYSVRGLMLPVMISSTAKKRMTTKMLGMPQALTDETRKSLIDSRPEFIAETAGFYKKLEKKSDIFW